MRESEMEGDGWEEGTDERERARGGGGKREKESETGKLSQSGAKLTGPEMGSVTPKSYEKSYHMAKLRN